MRTIATACAVPFFDGPTCCLVDHRRTTRALRGIVGSLVMGFGAVATVGVLIIAATVAAAWLLNIAVASNPHLQARAPTGPSTLALAGYDQAQTNTVPFETKWARATATMQVSAVPLMPEHPVALATNVPLPPLRPRAVQAKHEVVKTTDTIQVAKLAEPASAPAVPLPPKRQLERADSVPLPRPHPAPQLTAHPPQEQGAVKVQVASAPAAAPIEKRAQEPPRPLVAAKPQETPKVQEAHNKALALPTSDSRTAVYDISAHTVYLPNGDRLEAHSGLAEKMDNPRYVKVRMHGPTPPNVYELTLREEPFHGVRALRLNPIDDDKMFGRDGMLAHTYMLGPNGQSNGCVSFRDYDKFLNAYLKGEIDRLVVVANLENRSMRTARAQREPDYRYASNY